MWQLTGFGLLALVLAGGAVWYERSRPPAKLVAMVASLAALAVAGRIALAPIPNVVATTDIVLLSGYAMGAAPGYAVGALAALVSNFWLGQGPWTPWQMGAWGLVGIGGAALARLTAQRLGRLGLAAACGLAGLAYGAILDLSVMVTYGGEQSLERYLALSAAGVPFNVAHALGNVAFALIAGPVLVRMLLRFRARLEVAWREARPAVPGGREGSPVPGGARVVAGVLLVAACAGLGALAGSPQPVARAATSGATETVRWLVGAQNADGGFPATPGGESSVAMTGWAALGLEGAGRNPLDVRRGGNTPIDFLRANAGKIRSTGDLERTILVLDAAGLDPARFVDRDLVAELARRRRDDGSFERQVNLTAFALLALRATGSPAAELRRPSRWLRDAQNGDGGWGSLPGAPSEADSTGAVLQGLAAASAGEGAVRDGVRYLERSQHSSGGWPLARGGPVNSQSTAWAIQGLLAAGTDPAAVRSGGHGPFDYLAARQAADGHYRYSASSDQTPVWVTSQALLAVTRAPFPLDPVPRSTPAGTGGSSPASEPQDGRGNAKGGGSEGGNGGGKDTKKGSGPQGGKSEASRSNQRRPSSAGANPGAASAGTSPDTETDATLYIVAALVTGVVAAGALWRRRRER